MAAADLNSLSQVKNTNATPIETNHPSAVKQSRNARNESLAFKKVKSLRLYMKDGVPVGEAVSGEIIGEVTEKLTVSMIRRSGVLYQDRLMILRAAR